jgi:hypothetical protein
LYSQFVGLLTRKLGSPFKKDSEASSSINFTIRLLSHHKEM